MKLRMHVISAVFKRNFQSYFSGIIGYLFIVAFVALGSYRAFNPQFFANNLANLDQLNAVFPLLLLFFVPAITMSAWSEERKQGTDELLFTLPASDLEVLLGKYFAVLGVYSVALLFSLSHVVVLMVLGSPDYGLLFTTYFGYWISGAALLSCGMAASIMTNSAAVAYVLGALLCAIPVFIDNLAPNSRLLQGLSVSEQLRDFGLGMIPFGGLLYFISLTVLMLYVNLVLISRRHWQGGPHRTPMWAHYLARGIALAVFLISTTAIAASMTRRVDFTQAQLYSLSDTTHKVIRTLKPESPVTIQAFISPEVPRDLVATRSNLVGLLRQYGQQGGKNLQVRIVSTERYTDSADEAKRFGIEPQEIQSERGGRFVRDDVYLGVVISGSVDDQVIIPFFDKGTPIEYELTRSIRTVSQAQRKKVGVLRTDAQAIGGFDMQSFRQLPEWRIVVELKKQYDVKAVSPDDLAKSDIDVLVAIMPSSLTDPEAISLVEFIKRGKPTLIIDDPLPRFHPNLAPRVPKPKPGGPFGGGGMGGPQKADNGEARKLSDALGIAWDAGESVWDKYDAHPEFRDLFDAWRLHDVVYITPNNKARYAFDPDSSITKDLQELLLFYPGQIKPRDKSPLKFEPLLRSSPLSSVHAWDEYVQSSFMGITALLVPPDKDTSRNPMAPVIAARITGKLPPAGRPAGDKEAPADSGGEINVIFVADMDMISDEFFFIRDKEWQGLRLDNVTFILNAVDELAGDDAYLKLRSRRPKHSTLEAVESLTETAKKHQAEASEKADKEAQQKLEDARKRLKEEAEKIRNDKGLDEMTRQIRLATAQENERRRLEVSEAEIQNNKNRQLKEIKSQTEREVRKVETWISRLAIGLPPLPALLLGIAVFASRIKQERQGIIPDRLVGKK